MYVFNVNFGALVTVSLFDKVEFCSAVSHFVILRILLNVRVVSVDIRQISEYENDRYVPNGRGSETALGGHVPLHMRTYAQAYLDEKT